MEEVGLSEEELKELERPRHMSESYTSFDLPLASDETLYDRYVNTSGGFREHYLKEKARTVANVSRYGQTAGA